MCSKIAYGGSAHLFKCKPLYFSSHFLHALSLIIHCNRTSGKTFDAQWQRIWLLSRMRVWEVMKMITAWIYHLVTMNKTCLSHSRRIFCLIFRKRLLFLNMRNKTLILIPSCPTKKVINNLQVSIVNLVFTNLILLYTPFEWLWY